MSERKSLLVPLVLTQEEYDRIPLAKSCPPFHPKAMPKIGTRMRQEDGTVIEICKGTDMFEHQWGAGMCVPEIGMRWYQAIIQKTRITIDLPGHIEVPELLQEEINGLLQERLNRKVGQIRVEALQGEAARWN